MASIKVAAIERMLEALPEDIQDRVVEHIREYIAEIQDEIKWDISFNKIQGKLIAAARRAKQDIADGYAVPMDYGKL